MTSPPPAILLGGAANALSVARSLGRRGVPVVALNDAASHVRYSRFGRFVALAPGVDLQQAWLEWLRGPGRRDCRGGVLLPCCDDALELLAHHRKELEVDFVLAEANDEAVLAMLDKARTQALSAQAGVPAPRVWQVKDRDELRRILPEISFPCALKPCHSHLFSRHFPTRKLFVAESEAQLLEQFESTVPFGLEMLVTEIVAGGDDRYWGYFTYLDEAGRPLLQFIKHKLRQHPVGFGVGTFHISRWDPEVAELGLAFSQRTGLRGMVYVEFKRDARDGRLKLIECNPRFTGANELPGAVRDRLLAPGLQPPHGPSAPACRFLPGGGPLATPSPGLPGVPRVPAARPDHHPLLDQDASAPLLHPVLLVDRSLAHRGPERAAGPVSTHEEDPRAVVASDRWPRRHPRLRSWDAETAVKPRGGATGPMASLRGPGQGGARRSGAARSVEQGERHSTAGSSTMCVEAGA